MINTLLALNKVYCLDALAGLKQLEDETIDLILTSPPYWGLRNYGEEANKVWSGKEDCEHEWIEQVVGLVHENRNFLRGSQEEVHNKTRTTWIRKYDRLNSAFCSKCEAWYGQLGLEPDFNLYLDHLFLIFMECKRILKKTGSLWLNMGDTYAGSHCGRGDKTLFQNLKRQRYADNLYDKPSPQANIDLPEKCLIGIPWRLTLRLIDEGRWILRNCIIWYKVNHMPESVKDRFTKSYEFIFFFVKDRKYYFDLDSIRIPYKPLNRWGGPVVRKQEKTKGCLNIYAIQNRERYSQPNPIGKNPGDTWFINTEPLFEEHYAAFPQALCERIILAGCPENGIVLDPFCGSGRALAVAKRLGRQFIGFDIVPKFVDLALKMINKEHIKLVKFGVEV